MSEYSEQELLEAEAYAKEHTAPGRVCGTCTMCCKIPRIDVLQKPAGKWCPNCAPGKGCKIYETRPIICRRFLCLWMQDSNLGDAWKPEKSKMYLSYELSGERLAAHVDPATPGAWRKEPYYGDLKKWSVWAAENEKQVSVFIGRHAFVITPDNDIDLGIVDEDELIISTKEKQGNSFVLGAEKIKRDELEARQKEWAEARRRAATDFKP
jgi:hypothetical protein